MIKAKITTKGGSALEVETPSAIELTNLIKTLEAPVTSNKPAQKKDETKVKTKTTSFRKKNRYTAWTKKDIGIAVDDVLKIFSQNPHQSWEERLKLYMANVKISLNSKGDVRNRSHSSIYGKVVEIDKYLSGKGFDGRKPYITSMVREAVLDRKQNMSGFLTGYKQPETA